MSGDVRQQLAELGYDYYDPQLIAMIERIARQRAADELRAAAEGIWAHIDEPVSYLGRRITDLAEGQQP